MTIEDTAIAVTSQVGNPGNTPPDCVSVGSLAGLGRLIGGGGVVMLVVIRLGGW